MKLTKQFHAFFESEKSGGILLILCTIVSLTLANSAFSEDYIAMWHFPVGSHSFAHWINDGLMAIFFLLIGLELEREVYNGELSSLKTASLPAIAALGGILVPAGIHLFFNHGSATQAGAGIPMATDIAFAIGVLSLLGNRIPVSLKVFLTALAVIDDLGAIAVIAIAYTDDLSWIYFTLSLAIFCVLFVFNRLKVHKFLPYLIGGIAMWYFMLNSGVHATVAGVLLAFAIPFGDGSEKTLSYKVQHFLHKPVAFIILPLFALANTCFVIETNWYKGLLESNSLGIIIGLTAGKPIGIVLFTFAAVTAGVCTLPEDVSWRHIIGVGFLGGIGFTMSIFITLLAFNQSVQIDESKIAILIASVVSGAIGYFWLLNTANATEKE
ncbi:MAG: Na+/H+ antiporter NhaA [Bacteroidia bacterium]